MPELRVDAVWDIETVGWDQFLVGAVWDARDDLVHVYRDEDELAAHLLSLPKGATAWAHAGGKFDVLWLLDWCRRKDEVPEATIRLSGSSIASLAIKGGPVLRDSARLMPMALKEACTMFPGCAQKERLSFPCVCGQACGGYCSIAHDMTPAAFSELRDYLESDVLSLRDTLRGLITYAAQSQLTLANTVAGCGWTTAKERCKLWNAEWTIAAYKTARAGYFGGRPEVGRTEAPRIWNYDRKQAYPAALCKPVPVGESALLDKRSAVYAYSHGRPGIYYASVHVPEMFVPPLPVRYGERVVYPWGDIAGSWSRDELLRAEEVGCTVVKLHGGIAWAEEEAVLAPHVRHCFDLREAAGDNEALRTWLKFVANSLTGAFAQDPKFDMVVMGDFSDDPDYEPVGNYDWLWARELFAIPTRGHVHWAATLTADARVELHRQIVHAGDDWCYSDTDSVKSTRELTRRLGNGLGEWAFEGEGRDYVCLAPKVYSYETRTKKHPEWHRVVKAKGIPKAEGAWPRILSGEKVTLDRGVDSLLMAARKGESLFQRRAGTRQIKKRVDWCGARIRDGVRTRAPNVFELANLPR